MSLRFDNGGMSLYDIALAAGGKLLLSESRNVRGISTDTRKIKPDDLFIAIKGENFDGHDYICDAFKAGAAAVIAERTDGISGNVGNIILVDNTVAAFGRLAAAYKAGIDPFTVAVTGSVGKTTTKQFIYSVLSQKYNTHKTEGNFNNEIGLPLTLLEIKPENKAAVIELGMSAKGEIAYLSGLVRPDIGIITNIGTSHIEFLGSRESIRDAKMEIQTGLKSGGKLILNGDEPLLGGVGNAYYVSLRSSASDFIVKNLRFEEASTVFDIKYPDGIASGISVPAIGEHIALDAAFAFAAGYLAGIPVTDIKTGLSAYEPVGMRQKFEDYGGMTFIHDYYNASPESVRASLSVLAERAKKNGGRAVAVLGDMRELGSHSAGLHHDTGRFVADINADLLFTFGSDALNIAKGAAENGISKDRIFSVTDTEDAEGLGDLIISKLQKKDTVLFKASRGVKLERVTQYITGKEK